MIRMLEFIFRDKWINWTMIAFMPIAIVLLFLRAGSMAEDVAFALCVALLSGIILRIGYIVWCVGRGKRIAREPKAAVERRERINHWADALFFGVLLLLALWKWIARLWA